MTYDSDRLVYVYISLSNADFPNSMVILTIRISTIVKYSEWKLRLAAVVNILLFCSFNFVFYLSD